MTKATRSCADNDELVGHEHARTETANATGEKRLRYVRCEEGRRRSSRKLPGTALFRLSVWDGELLYAKKGVLLSFSHACRAPDNAPAAPSWGTCDSVRGNFAKMQRNIRCGGQVAAQRLVFRGPCRAKQGRHFLVRSSCYILITVDRTKKWRLRFARRRPQKPGLQAATWPPHAKPAVGIASWSQLSIETARGRRTKLSRLLTNGVRKLKRERLFSSPARRRPFATRDEAKKLWAAVSTLALVQPS